MSEAEAKAMIGHVGTGTIETDRLILRRYEMRDADDMFANWVTDPEVSRFWSWEPHRDIAQTRAILREWITAYENLETYHWVIVLKETTRAIGYLYLSEIDNAQGSCSVHYLLGRKFWNNGFATEACGAAVKFAFGIGFDKILSRHHADNPASGRVMQKCGMRPTGTQFRRFADCARISGDYRFYEITRNDWLRRE